MDMPELVPVCPKGMPVAQFRDSEGKTLPTLFADSDLEALVPLLELSPTDMM